MKILAIDSSSKAGSCALAISGKLIGEYYLNNATTHSQTLLPMIDSLLHSCNVQVSDLDYIAITNGPGSFTGLRIGLATVKGLSFGQNIKVIPVSTLEATAYNLSDLNGTVAVAMDARRNQVYTGVYSFLNHSIEQLLKPSMLDINELAQFLINSKDPIYLTGDGAHLCYDRFKDILPNINLISDKLRHQHASSIIEMVLQNKLYNNAIDQSQLELEYLRIPQAQRELKEAEELL